MGTWTIPTTPITGIPGSEGISQIVDITENAIDAFSGATINIPTVTRPMPYAKLVTVSGTGVVKIGEPLTITLSNVKPNTQVWIAETAMGNLDAMSGANVIGGYVGMTSLTGDFVWQTTVGNWLEGHAYQIWVGNWCGDSQVCGARLDSDIVSTVFTWATNASGVPAAPGNFAQLTNK